MGRALTDQTSADFFNAPTVARFQAIQQRVFASEAYDPSASELLLIESQISSASPVRLMGDLAALSPVFRFAPRFHYIQARIHESLGELAEMQCAIRRLKSCLKIITQSGEGSKQRPFSISFLPDEDDVLRALEHRVRCRHLAAEGDRHFEVVTAHSGAEIWFDIGPLLAAASPARLGVG